MEGIIIHNHKNLNFTETTREDYGFGRCSEIFLSNRGYITSTWRTGFDPNSTDFVIFEQHCGMSHNFFIGNLSSFNWCFFYEKTITQKEMKIFRLISHFFAKFLNRERENE